MARYSIILPVRNGGRYVQTCVRSILSQSVPDFELVVLDSGSTDGTPEWIRSLDDRRIKSYPAPKPLTIEENWGRIVSIPRNEFMTLIGHDDVLHPFYLQEMEALISRHPSATLYQAHYRYIDGNGDFVRHCLPMDEVQYAHEFLACHMARTMDSMGTGYLMRSSDYDRVGGMPRHYPHLLFADYELWINLMRLGYKATTPADGFGYRVHQNLSKTTNGMLYQEAFGRYVGFIKGLMEQDPAMKRTTETYGKEMLYYYCESLSHRLLKTPIRDRSLKVSEFIAQCERYAAELIPGQEFFPNKRFRTRIAGRIDRSLIGRGIFHLYKRLG